MGIYLIFGKFGKKCGVGQLPLSGALKPPVRQLRNGFSNSAQNLDSETIFKPFGLDGWLKVSYLLDYYAFSQFFVCRDVTLIGPEHKRAEDGSAVQAKK